MAPSTLLSELEQLLCALDKAQDLTTPISLQVVAERIARDMGVREDEVAILEVSRKWNRLNFVTPERLKNVGHIPLSSNSALAARTARQSRPEIINDFAKVRHASVFEGVRVAEEKTPAIKKIISAPIFG